MNKQVVNVYFGATFVDNKYFFQRNKKESNPSVLLLSKLAVDIPEGGFLSLESMKSTICSNLTIAQRESNKINHNWAATHLLLHVQEERAA